MGHRPPGPPPPWAVSSSLLAEAGMQGARVCPLSPSPTLLLPRAWSWPMDLQPEILEQRTGVRSWRPLLAPRAPWAQWPEHERCPAWPATPACLFPPRHLWTHTDCGPCSPAIFPRPVGAPVLPQPLVVHVLPTCCPWVMPAGAGSTGMMVPRPHAGFTGSGLPGLTQLRPRPCRKCL